MYTIYTLYIYIHMYVYVFKVYIFVSWASPRSQDAKHQASLDQWHDGKLHPEDTHPRNLTYQNGHI